MTPRLLLFILIALLSGCDQINQRLGIKDPIKQDNEGKAVGGACRQSGRAIEDCYSIYHWLPKASIYAGWREMNDYMQANNIQVVEPRLPPPPPPEDPRKKKKKVATEETGSENSPNTNLSDPSKTELAPTQQGMSAQGKEIKH